MSREDLHRKRVEKDLDSVLLQYKGAVGVDVDLKEVNNQKTDKFGLTIYVKKKLPKEELSDEEAVPAEVEGIPTDVVECPNVWPSPDTTLKVEGLEPKVQTPVLSGGLSISNQYNLGSYGTLGIVIFSGGAPVALSCAHVMVSPPPGPGQGVIEPGGPQGGKWPADSIGTVSIAHYGGTSNVDAAITPITTGRGYYTNQVLGIGNILGVGAAVITHPVRKTGATTGYTEGIVSSLTLTWSYTDPRLGTITLYNQVKVDNYGGKDFALPGDSGSAVIDAGLKLVGIVVSGSPGHFTVCNPISDLAKVIPPLMS